MERAVVVAMVAMVAMEAMEAVKAVEVLESEGCKGGILNAPPTATVATTCMVVHDGCTIVCCGALLYGYSNNVAMHLLFQASFPS